MTQRIEPFFFEYDAKTWFFFYMIQRIELFWNDSWSWTSFYELLLNMTQRVGVFSQYDSKSSTFLVFPYDSKNWTFFFLQFDSKNCVFLNLTQRVEPFLMNMTQWIEPLFEYDSENWTSFLSMTQRIWFFWNYPKKWTNKKKRWKNRTAFIMTQRIEFFFQKKTQTNEFLSMTHRMEHFFFFIIFQDDSKSWSLFSTWLKELNPLFFSKCLKELNFSFFFKMLKELNLSFIWTTFLHDSMNWIFFSIWLEELSLF